MWSLQKTLTLKNTMNPDFKTNDQLHKPYMEAN